MKIRRHVLHGSGRVFSRCPLLPPNLLTPVPETMTWDLPSSAQAPRLARRYLAEALPDISAHARDVVHLMVTETVTNAVRHGSGPVTMELLTTSAGVRVAVRDNGSRVPQQRTSSALEEGGRGLQIIAALATEWGVTPARTGSGKTVWFEVGVSISA